ncbi:hypothetical protein OSB04_026127 [Centaurea solstitialis]|uniref:Pyruvate kinase n=1 Tax=Centaurea solstitialis TaxID=347529 RepID=A0AA38SNF1_9ASTR|nr:hypothetical protein OSB04_026127 [Centaurea solstitialis]
MLESMIVHLTPTRAEVSDIAIAVREGADAVMLFGETAHGKLLVSGMQYVVPLKAVNAMHTVSLRTESSIMGGGTASSLNRPYKNHMSEMFAYHATSMSNTLGTSIVVFTRTSTMAVLLSHYRPNGTIFAFTDEEPHAVDELWGRTRVLSWREKGNHMPLVRDQVWSKARPRFEASCEDGSDKGIEYFS